MNFARLVNDASKSYFACASPEAQTAIVAAMAKVDELSSRGGFDISEMPFSLGIEALSILVRSLNRSLAPTVKVFIVFDGLSDKLVIAKDGVLYLYSLCGAWAGTRPYNTVIDHLTQDDVSELIR